MIQEYLLLSRPPQQNLIPPPFSAVSGSLHVYNFGSLYIRSTTASEILGLGSTATSEVSRHSVYAYGCRQRVQCILQKVAIRCHDAVPP